MNSYLNHFSEHSAEYLHFRPDYPDALYDYLASLLTDHNLAWDVGTGNGQAAVKLADYFRDVIATDKSQEQLDVAYKKSNVHYYCWPVDKTEIDEKSIDLITVAQALHWFDLDRFYREVRRVLKADGIIAVWCYSLCDVEIPVNHLLIKLYTDILGDAYWPKERRYLDEEYQTILFPFERISTPKFLIERKYNFADFLGYLNTWSAVKEYKKRNQNKNPIDLIYDDLSKAWGNPETKYRVEWPLHLLVGKQTRT